jgi:uncharacterized protein
MQFSGDYRFAQSARQIWNALNDPAVLKQTIPGCEDIHRVSETEFTGIVKIAVGPMKFRFSGTISLGDLDPPWRYTITCTGSGGLAGLAKGTARVTMNPDLHHPLGHGTLLRYHTEVALSGMIATLAEKFLQGTATRLADEFFARFASHIPPEREPDMIEEPTTPVSAPTPLIEPETITVEAPPSLPPVVWSVGLSLLVAIILAFSIR